MTAQVEKQMTISREIPVNDATLLKWLLDATNPTTRWAGERIKQLKAESEATAINRDMLAALSELADLMQGVIDGDYKPDSFTLQPARAAIARAEAHEGQRNNG